MKIESEKLLERKLSKLTKDNGGLCLKLLSTHYTGLPDRMCIFPKGKIIFVEVKTTKQKTTKIQNVVHSKIRSLGFRVEVVDSTESIKQLIRKCLKTKE